MSLDESLTHFKQRVAELLSMDTSDPNMGVDFATRALGLIHSYASDSITWSEFVSETQALIDEARDSE